MPGLDGQAAGDRGWQHGVPVALFLGLEGLPARHRDHAHLLALLGQGTGGLQTDPYLRAGGEDDAVERVGARALGLPQHVRTLAGVVARLGQDRQTLAQTRIAVGPSLRSSA